MPFNGVSAEARGKLRRWKVQLARDSAQVEAAVDTADVRRIIQAVALKKSPVGRDRAIKKLRKLLPPLRLEWLGGSYSVWSYLTPRESVIAKPSDPGQSQDAVTMNYMVGGASSRGGFLVSTGHWSLEIPDHALGRALERHRDADLVGMLYDAHRALLAAQSIRPLPDRTHRFYLTAGDGVFAGNFVVGWDRAQGKDDIMVYFRARTWLHNDQLYENQKILSKGYPRWVDGPLLPPPLRMSRLCGDELEIIPLSRMA